MQFKAPNRRHRLRVDWALLSILLGGIAVSCAGTAEDRDPIETPGRHSQHKSSPAAWPEEGVIGHILLDDVDYPTAVDDSRAKLSRRNWPVSWLQVSLARVEDRNKVAGNRYRETRSTSPRPRWRRRRAPGTCGRPP